MPAPLLAAGAIIGGVAQLGQSIYGMVQGNKMIREANKVKKPKAQVQQEFEQNRAMALNRYNAANPFMAQATANLNTQTASATIAAQQTASDSAAALQAISGVTANAQNQQANIMAQASQQKDARALEFQQANAALAADKNRITQLQQDQYLMAQQQKSAGQQNIMNAIGGIGSFGGDIFSMAAQYPDAFKGLGQGRSRAGTIQTPHVTTNTKSLGLGYGLNSMPIGFMNKFGND